MTRYYYGFKDRFCYTEYDVRVGVCNRCRAIVPFDTQGTLRHHEQYHEDDPLKDTIELCRACHGLAHTKPYKQSRGNKSTLFASVSNELEYQFRLKVLEVYGKKRGGLSMALEEAFSDWVNKKK